MARRHALFSGRHALFPSAMPFFRAPCVQNVPFLTQMLSRPECDDIELTATPYVLVHGTPKVARPPESHPNYPCTQLLNLQSVTLLIEGSHLTRGGVNASPITPGRTLP